MKKRAAKKKLPRGRPALKLEGQKRIMADVSSADEELLRTIGGTASRGVRVAIAAYVLMVESGCLQDVPELHKRLHEVV